MKIDITAYRLHNQLLSQTSFTDPAQVVSWFGAVQAQDYAGAKWALGQRLKNGTEADIDRAYDEGKILRTHAMRPTWHFVAPAELRWLLKLTASRVHAANASMHRSLGVDAALIHRSQAVVEKALKGGQSLTREELTLALKQAGISSENQLKMTYLIMSGEVDGLICSGPRRGKQFTYALLEERVPPQPHPGPQQCAGRACPAILHQPWARHPAGFCMVVRFNKYRCREWSGNGPFQAGR